MMKQIPGVGAIALLIALLASSALQDSGARAGEESNLTPSQAMATAQQLQISRISPSRAELALEINGEERIMALEHAIVWAAEGEVLIDLGDGEMRSRAPLEIETYRGTVVGSPDSRAAITVDASGEIRGLILMPDEGMASIEPANAEGMHLVQAADAGAVLGLCGTDTSGFVSHASSSAGDRASGILHEAELAFDADREYYVAKNRSVPQVEASIASLVNAANLIFERDAGVTHRITTIIVRTMVNDPYSATNAPDALDEFRTYWNSNHSAVARDAAHLVTGRAMAGGIIGRAFLGSLCARTFAYGFSNVTFDADFAQQTILLTHEIAHNWNAPHCDVMPGECHIMCSLINSCDGAGAPNLSPAMAGEITGLAESESCLDLIVVDCPGDADGSGLVNFADITMVLGNWLADYGAGTGDGDADASGSVNFADITAVLSNWLSVCS